MPVKRAGKLETIGPKAENGLKRGLILSGKLVSQRASRKAPVKMGRLKRSITEGQPYVVALFDWAVDVGTNVVYAAIHEFGGTIKAHPISARFKNALAFEWPGAPAGARPQMQVVNARKRTKKTGKFEFLYFFRSVNHPGSVIKAQPYLRPALAESRVDIRRILINSVVGAIKGDK